MSEGANILRVKLKEKSSFTKDWVNEPLSIGLFYYINERELFNILIFLKKLNCNFSFVFFRVKSSRFHKLLSIFSFGIKIKIRVWLSR